MAAYGQVCIEPSMEVPLTAGRRERTRGRESVIARTLVVTPTGACPTVCRGHVGAQRRT